MENKNKTKQVGDVTLHFNPCSRDRFTASTCPNLLECSGRSSHNKRMKNKLFKIQYGNGWLGSRKNIGSVLVLAPDAKAAKVILKDKKNIKLGHIGSATQIAFLS